MKTFCIVLVGGFLIELYIYQGAAADSEAKSEELSRAVEELQKLLKDAGEGASL